ncbi:uncharacterized protein [Apostichopus japonicus]|uniref:uncharacterized protein n=1 Tax=Stichopus japonicus TaxID=307972 RepID=UPI003AB257BF
MSSGSSCTSPQRLTGLCIQGSIGYICVFLQSRTAKLIMEFQGPIFILLCLVLFVEAQQDLICAVINPVARRRAPAKNIILHAAVGDNISPIALGATYAIQFERAVKTGRWPNLPDNTLSPEVNSPALQPEAKLVFKPQPKSRGQRFGVFAAQLVQTQSGTETVLTESLCVAQENSKLYTPRYTFTGNVGDVTSIELRAYVPPDRLANIRWSFTDIVTGIRTELPSENGNRAITVQPLLANSGIYEAYVDGRYERTWGAIFRVIIRRCSSIMCGPDCTTSCGDCNVDRGYPDEDSKVCVCIPGYTGTDCSTPCPAGFVGQNCNIDCEAVFGQPGCKNMLLCAPHPTGCYCYQQPAATGLKPPYCACPANRYGTDCSLTCACAANELCDPFDGSCVPDYSIP